MIRVCGFKEGIEDTINTTSRSKNWSRGLSPFYCGPVKLYEHDGILLHAKNVENGWQYSKCYREFLDENENPTERYFEWAKRGWDSTRAERYPMGKGRKPVYSYWEGRKLTYLEARKAIYCPMYAKAVQKTDAYNQLKKIIKEKEEIWLWDFDGYDHISLGMSLKDVLNSEKRKMGHAFVLAGLLQDDIFWL
jgi:hypothetical protein